MPKIIPSPWLCHDCEYKGFRKIYDIDFVEIGKEVHPLCCISWRQARRMAIYTIRYDGQPHTCAAYEKAQEGEDD